MLLLGGPRERLERGLAERHPVGGQRGEVGERLREKLVALHGGGAAQVLRRVPAVGPHQLVVEVVGDALRPKVATVACECAPPLQTASRSR